MARAQPFAELRRRERPIIVLQVIGRIPPPPEKELKTFSHRPEQGVHREPSALAQSLAMNCLTTGTRIQFARRAKEVMCFTVQHQADLFVLTSRCS